MNALVQTDARQRAVVEIGDGAHPSEQTQYLTFMLDGETFAVGILAVREIIEYESVTVVPMMPESIRGVINLRGAVVPVVDLSVRFGRKPAAVTKRTCIVIVETLAGEERQVVGVVVDAVNAVRDIPASEIEPPPTLGARIRSDFIKGMGKVDGKFIILLNAAEALSADDIEAMEALTADR